MLPRGIERKSSVMGIWILPLWQQHTVPPVQTRRLPAVMYGAERLQVGGFVAPTMDLRDDVVDVCGWASAPHTTLHPLACRTGP